MRKFQLLFVLKHGNIKTQGLTTAKNSFIMVSIDFVNHLNLSALNFSSAFLKTFW